MISLAIKSQSRQIAEIHKKSIVDGFLSKLGVDFLTVLYEYLIQNELVLAYVENNKVIGFVSCSYSSSGLIKKFVLKKPKAIFILLKKIILNPSFIKPIFETSKSTSNSTTSVNVEKLPETELLSISVLSSTQQKGVGSILLKGLENQLLLKNIQTYKVVAGDKLISANSFYIKNGFELINQVKIHGDEISNVYVKKINR
jgi:ribosomal protein S18 acetylase RimI-like enzyme